MAVSGAKAGGCFLFDSISILFLQVCCLQPDAQHESSGKSLISRTSDRTLNHFVYEIWRHHIFRRIKEENVLHVSSSIGRIMLCLVPSVSILEGKEEMP